MAVMINLAVLFFDMQGAGGGVIRMGLTGELDIYKKKKWLASFKHSVYSKIKNKQIVCDLLVEYSYKIRISFI